MHALGRTAVAVTALLALAPATAVAAATDLDPASLPRGTDLGRPYLEGTTLVDGALRIALDVRRPVLVAPARSGYVVADRSRGTASLVGRDGSSRRLPGADEDTVVSPDGRFYSQAGLVSDGETEVVVRRTRDGARLASHVFRSWVDANVGRFVSPVDIWGRRMLLSGSGGRVMVWSWPRDRVATVRQDRWHLQVGSIRDDVAAGWTAPGRRCTVVAPLSRPGRVSWRSCGERVLAIAPGGRRMVTTRSGSATVSAITLRTVDGPVLRRWRGVRIEDVAFESSTTVAFRLVGPTSTSMVRCSASQCANASDPVPLG